MNRRDDVYHPPTPPVDGPPPDFCCPRCHQAITVIMGNVVDHDCPRRNKQRNIPPRFERMGTQDWMV